MEQKKSKGLLIAIIIIFIIIILLVGAMAYLYFFTDVLKSNKQLFFKYGSQLVQSENGFIDNDLIQYLQKKTTASYENNGKITFEVDIPNEQDKLELANNFNITFSGKDDPSNSKTEKQININYSDSVNFPLTYRKTNDVKGIQTKYIGNNFVAAKNTEEISGLEKINNLINLQNLKFSSEEIQNLKATYIDNILNTFDDSKFSKLEEGDLIGYKLTLTNEELKNILSQMLTTLKNDTNTANKLNDILKAVGNKKEFDESYIDDLIEKVNELNLDSEIEIIVYAKDGVINKLSIQNSGRTFIINKEQNGQERIYTLSFNETEKNTNIVFTAKYAGLNSDNVTEDYEITLEGKYEDTNMLEQSEDEENTITISSEKENIQSLISNIKENKIENGEDSEQITDTDIEELLSSGTNEMYEDMRLEKETDTSFNITFISTGDKFVIDNTGKIIEEPEGENTTTEEVSQTEESDKTINKYIITNNVQFKNDIQIEELTDENAVILDKKDEEYINNLMNAIRERLIEVNKVQMEELGVSETENPIQYLIPSILTGNTASIEIDEQAVNSFNQKFELYQSTNTKGATVKGLLTVIQNNNESEEGNKIEEINFDGEEYEPTEQNITFLKSEINVDDAYRVEFEKDSSTGLIYRAVINKR